jgi:hypothetical protein
MVYKNINTIMIGYIHRGNTPSEHTIYGYGYIKFPIIYITPPDEKTYDKYKITLQKIK